MLLSVPDPFDSYGPPQSVDQIFSILAPLSITPSTSLSAAASSVFSSGQTTPTTAGVGQHIPEWLNGMHSPIHNTSKGYPEHQSREEAEDEEDESDLEDENSPRSRSPSISPPPLPSKLQQHQRARKDSALRNVLSVIDESQNSQYRNGTTPRSPLVGDEPPPSPWASSGYEYGGSGGDERERDRDRTPRHSMQFPLKPEQEPGLVVSG